MKTIHNLYLKIAKQRLSDPQLPKICEIKEKHTKANGKTKNSFSDKEKPLTVNYF